MTRRTVGEHADLVRRLLLHLLSPEAEEVPLRDARGRCTAADILSPVDLPLFRNSQMDGYAVRAAEVESVPVTLPVVGSIAAGDGVGLLDPGTAARIMTGAPVPRGADAIVPVEDTTTVGERVTIERSRIAGEYVRDRASDVRAGDTLLPGGTVLASRHLGALAASGIAMVSVRRRIRIAILSTGAELAEPGSAPAEGQTFDANSTALAAACEEAGAHVVRIATTDDEADAFARTLKRFAAGADLVITSGGISKGDYEVVRQTVEPLGGWVGEIGMQPGGPQALTVLDGTPVVSFPGNPVSSQVSFTVFLRPLLREAAGLPPIRSGAAEVVTAFVAPAGKTQFRRGRLRDDRRVELIGGPSSHLVAALARADVLVVAEPGTRYEEGDTVEVIPL